jgi:hypothetical protein
MCQFIAENPNSGEVYQQHKQLQKKSLGIRDQLSWEVNLIINFLQIDRVLGENIKK